MAEGLLLYEDGLNRFGVPRSVAEDDDADGWYEVDDSATDHMEAALARWQKDNPSPEPGAVPRVIDTRPAVSSAH